MAWSLVGISTPVKLASTSGGTLTPNVPSGIQPGDLLVVAISYRGTTAITPPASGWTAIVTGQVGNIATNTTAVSCVLMVYTIYSGTMPNLSFVKSSAGGAVGVMAAYRSSNAGTITLVDSSTIQPSSSASGSTTPAKSGTAVGAVSGQDLVIGLLAQANNSNTGLSITGKYTASATASGNSANTTAGALSLATNVLRANDNTGATADCRIGLIDFVIDTAGTFLTTDWTTDSSARHASAAAIFREPAASVSSTNGQFFAFFG